MWSIMSVFTHSMSICLFLHRWSKHSHTEKYWVQTPPCNTLNISPPSDQTLQLYKHNMITGQVYQYLPLSKTHRWNVSVTKTLLRNVTLFRYNACGMKCEWCHVRLLRKLDSFRYSRCHGSLVHGHNMHETMVYQQSLSLWFPHFWTDEFPWLFQYF